MIIKILEIRHNDTKRRWRAGSWIENFDKMTLKPFYLVSRVQFEDEYNKSVLKKIIKLLLVMASFLLSFALWGASHHMVGSEPLFLMGALFLFLGLLGLILLAIGWQPLAPSS